MDAARQISLLTTGMSLHHVRAQGPGQGRLSSPVPFPHRYDRRPKKFVDLEIQNAGGVMAQQSFFPLT